MTSFIEIPFTNGYRVIISKGDYVFVALENPAGYVVSDRKLTKEQFKTLEGIISKFEPVERGH